MSEPKRPKKKIVVLSFYECKNCKEDYEIRGTSGPVKYCPGCAKPTMNVLYMEKLVLIREEPFITP